MIHDASHRPLDLDAGTLGEAPAVWRHLRDLGGCFADRAAFETAAAAGNPPVYSVSSAEPESGPGALHFGLGRLLPGRVGDEYYQTRGHFHAWRGAAEVYVGLRGSGYLLLEEEASGESRLLPLTAGTTVYVPGGTAHRTINTGAEPLVYLGVYPAHAGHDYAGLAHSNFRQILLAGPEGPRLMARQDFIPRSPS